jgi:poly(3-hydroxybutyrate) depolymerase
MPQTIRLFVSGRAAVVPLVLAMLTGAGHAQEARMVPVTVDGERVRLEMRVYTPATATPSPTLVFNHGSTGRGTNPESFTRSIDFPEVARFFVARGWAVVIPARRGRGGAEGQYDEGFGGRGTFHELPAEFGGHFIWRRPDRWGPSSKTT